MNHNKKIEQIIVTLLVISLYSINICFAQGGDPQPHKDPFLKLSKDTLVLKVNEQFQLMASIDPPSMEYHIISWSTPNNKIIILSPYGNVTGIKEGKAIVIANDMKYPFLADTCIVIVEKISPCFNNDFKTEQITLCTGTSRTFTTSEFFTEWYDSPLFNTSIGFGTNFKLSFDTDTVIEIFQTHRIGEYWGDCLYLDKKYTIRVLPAPFFDSTLLLNYDTLCLNSTNVLPYSDLLWFNDSTDTGYFHSGISFPSITQTGDYTYYIQQEAGCPTLKHRFNFHVRDCSGDFTPVCSIYGNVSPYFSIQLPLMRIYLLDINNDNHPVDSIESKDGNFILRVPFPESYTIKVTPTTNSVYTTTYYGNTKSLSEASNISIHENTTCIKGVDLKMQLEKSLDDDYITSSLNINANNNTLTVKCNDCSKTLTINIVSIDGKTQITGQIKNQESLDLSNLLPGFYTAEIIDNKRLFFKPFIIK